MKTVPINIHHHEEHDMTDLLSDSDPADFSKLATYHEAFEATIGRLLTDEEAARVKEKWWAAWA